LARDQQENYLTVTVARLLCVIEWHRAKRDWRRAGIRVQLFDWNKKMSFMSTELVRGHTCNGYINCEFYNNNRWCWH